eukprot:CAMPEP_0171092316 /NCGR_PEP_ID=MMETSP0766_2-20121228/35620_1 /TAXON_ID=439317 /ORGANISM="Gambierdiscus australes, Strain CAWD 149" /LENGTH=33 /DNA_ID= /DNA_START= /DNA_END= /DNA_ORIENTATION=
MPEPWITVPPASTTAAQRAGMRGAETGSLMLIR